MDIFEEIVRLRKAGRKGALATIVEVQGSIPSHESSKILIRDDGSIAGTVGGGPAGAERAQLCDSRHLIAPETQGCARSAPARPPRSLSEIDFGSRQIKSQDFLGGGLG